jgi:diguanylate cyclase
MAVNSQARTNVTSLSVVREQRLDVQLRQLEFSACLHRKLDLELLFDCVMAEGQAFVQFDGLRFHAADRGVDLTLGDMRQHRQRFELKLGDRPLGEIELARGKAFSAREEREAERVAENLVYPLDNALSHHEALLAAMTDAPTGLRNLECLEQQLPREVRAARRTGLPLSLVLFSVDYLESISEHHGSAVGEQAWRAVAETLGEALRRSDLVFRSDGDAFCVALPDTDIDEAAGLANRLRERVDRCVSLDNVQFVLTASAGVASLADLDNAGTLLERAREALSLAHRGGRNRVRALHEDDQQFDPNDGPDAA